MIRSPSSASALFAWWKAAIAGQQPPFHDGIPECGFYKVRLVRGGPWAPARIWVDRDIDPETGELTGDERYLCEIDGQRRDARKVWDGRLIPISRDDYQALIHARSVIPAMQATLARMDLTQTIMRPT